MTDKNRGPVHAVEFGRLKIACQIQTGRWSWHHLLSRPPEQSRRDGLHGIGFRLSPRRAVIVGFWWNRD